MFRLGCPMILIDRRPERGEARNLGYLVSGSQDRDDECVKDESSLP